MRSARPGRLLFALLALAAPARAEDPVSPAERTTTLRAGFPKPERPLRFEADVSLSGRRIGRVRYAAEPSELDGETCWLVRERFVRQAGEGRVAEESEVWLGRDLSLKKGSTSFESPTERGAWEMRAFPSGVRVSAEGPDGKKETVGKRDGKDLTFGMTATLLFLREAPAEPGTWFLPVVAPALAGHDARAAAEDATIETRGAGQPARVTTKRGEVWEVRFAEGTRDPVAVVGEMPRLAMLPPGEAGPAPEWFDRVEEPSRDAMEAFVRFGRGYHLPRRDLLEKAFHWPSMLDHEVKAGTWDKSQPIEAFREAWVREFEGMSKHRSEADADDLLIQTLMYSRETVHPDGRVTVDTHAAYGDWAYTMAAVDGEWFIVSVD